MYEKSILTCRISRILCVTSSAKYVAIASDMVKSGNIWSRTQFIVSISIAVHLDESRVS